MQVDFVPDGDGFLRNCEISPIFSVDVLERSASKGHGLVTSVAAGNNVLLVGTNKGWIVRHDFLSSDSLGWCYLLCIYSNQISSHSEDVYWDSFFLFLVHLAKLEGSLYNRGCDNISFRH